MTFIKINDNSAEHLIINNLYIKQNIMKLLLHYYKTVCTNLDQ